jgi:hypothetical protein
MTLERWYHRAAIVIWPRTTHFQVLCGAGTDASIGGLAPMVNRLKRATKAQREEQRRTCLSFAAAIIDTWQPDRRGQAWKETDRVDRNVFPGLLCTLDDTSLVRRFLMQVMPVDSAVQLDKSFTGFCKKHGWAAFQEELSQLIEKTTNASIIRNAELLRILCVERDKNAERLELCRRLCEAFANAVKASDARRGSDEWHYGTIDRSALLVSTVTAMLAVGAETPLSALLEHASACDKYDLTDAHLAAIFTLESRIAKSPGSSAAISRWLAACRRELVRRTAQAPRKPTDYRRDHKLSCNCADCRALSAFLADPSQREGRFPLAETRRRHLHDIIARHRCDCTHVTHRQGRPFTLVCTKTTASYEAACKIDQRDVDNLARLVALEKRRD